LIDENADYVISPLITHSRSLQGKGESGSRPRLLHEGNGMFFDLEHAPHIQIYVQISPLGAAADSVLDNTITNHNGGYRMQYDHLLSRLVTMLAASRQLVMATKGQSSRPPSTSPSAPMTTLIHVALTQCCLANAAGLVRPLPAADANDTEGASVLPGRHRCIIGVVAASARKPPSGHNARRSRRAAQVSRQSWQGSRSGQRCFHKLSGIGRSPAAECSE
jgi:hypothetical protein